MMRYLCQSPCCCRDNGCYILYSSVLCFLFSELFKWMGLLQLRLRHSPKSEQILLLGHLILSLNGSFLHFIFPYVVFCNNNKKIELPEWLFSWFPFCQIAFKERYRVSCWQRCFLSYSCATLSYYADWEVPLTLIINVILILCMVYLLF